MTSVLKLLPKAFFFFFAQFTAFFSKRAFHFWITLYSCSSAAACESTLLGEGVTTVSLEQRSQEKQQLLLLLYLPLTLFLPFRKKLNRLFFTNFLQPVFLLFITRPAWLILEAILLLWRQLVRIWNFSWFLFVFTCST